MPTYDYDAQALVPTASKTAAYTAAVNDLVIVDASSSSVAITLPTAPPDLSTVGVKRYDATFNAANVPTVAPGGADAFLGGSTSAVPLLSQGQTIIYQYSASRAQWIARSTDQPLPPGFVPADYGYIGWAYDPISAYASNLAITAGQAYFTLVPVRQATKVTNVVLHVGAAGSGLTSGQCFAGLFDGNGNLLSATADQSTNWQTAGLWVMPLTAAQSVAAGWYFVGFFANGTTLPKFFYNAAALSGIGDSGRGPGVNFSRGRFNTDTTHTGLTTAFHTPATLGGTNDAFWAAVS